MAEIKKLLDLLTEENAMVDLSQRLRSDNAKLGLSELASIIEQSIKENDDGKLVFQIWNESQIESLLSVLSYVVYTTRSLTVEAAESALVRVFESSVEFCIYYVEKCGLNGDHGADLQKTVIHLLEIALLDKVDTDLDSVKLDSPAVLMDCLPVIPANSSRVKQDRYMKCTLRGINCSVKAEPVDTAMLALASEYLPANRQVSLSTEDVPHQDWNSMISLSQHWAVVHGKCIPRLINICKELLKPSQLSDEHNGDSHFQSIVILSKRILSLVARLTREAPYVASDVELLLQAAALAELLPELFKHRHDPLNFDSCAEEKRIEHHLMVLMEDFFHFVEAVFHSDNIFLNIKTCISASMLNILDTQVWSYDKHSSIQKPPLVFAPQVIMYLLKLIGEVRTQTCQVLSWKQKSDINSVENFMNSEIGVAPSFNISSEKVSLVERYTSEQLLRLIFPIGGHWLDDLIHLASFLHSQGVKYKVKNDRLRQVRAKSPAPSDKDPAVSHEDDALFGDLFCEPGRQGGMTDTRDQPPVASDMINIGTNIPLQGAIELLTFLKSSIFSPEWDSSVCKEACVMLHERHISILLSMLQFQVCLFDEGIPNSAVSACQKQLGHVSDVSFDLLYSLLARRALSRCLEEHLASQILKVEKGHFVYNDYTLVLLAHAMISRVGLSGRLFRIKVFEAYIDFILEKANDVCSNCPSLGDTFAGLPSLFHFEILLMAFHSSSVSEKVSFAKRVFDALQAVSHTPAEFSCTLLTAWSLLVSRLILILRHMIYYPSTFPSWLLSHIRTKLREVPSRGSSSGIVNDRLLSWVSTTIQSIMAVWVKDRPVLGNLLPLLIDVVPVPNSASLDGQVLQDLGLNQDDVHDAFSQILGLWKGKKAEAVEDLVLERYCFLLCWDTLSCIRSPSVRVDTWSLDLGRMDSFIQFSHFLVSKADVTSYIGSGNFTEVVTSVLQQLSITHEPFQVKERTWDFLRDGAWLSLILSLLQVGIGRFSEKDALQGLESCWVEDIHGGNYFLSIAESVVVALFQNNQVGSVIEWLSVLLHRYLHALQEAFVMALDRQECEVGLFSSSLLLIQSGCEQCPEAELLEKIGASPALLEYLYGLGSKLNELVEREDLENLSRAFRRSLLHGFPSHLQTNSGALLSCIVSVEGIICTFESLIKVKDSTGAIHIDDDVLLRLLDSVMMVKLGRIFEHIHGKLDVIYSYFFPSEKGNLDHSVLFLLKHMENFLKEVVSREKINLGVLEVLIKNTVDLVDRIRKDPAKVDSLKCYLGINNDKNKEAKKLYPIQNGNLLVLLDVLDTCHTEAVSMKILQLFNDLLSGELCCSLKVEAQKKFLGMDLACLSKWLEKKLLGCMIETSGGVSTAKGSPVALRELTLNVIICLVSPSSEINSKELRLHFVEAMLMSLEDAFMQFDIHTAKAYFNSIFQLCNGDSSMRHLVEKTVRLMDKFLCDERFLEGLKFLFGFLWSILSACGANKGTGDKFSGKHWSSSSSGAASTIPRTVGSVSSQGSETLVLPSSQESGSATVDCDATSVDEDEDDGTSDGELASVDKDDDDDSNNERALASKVCTFTSSGSNFMEQHWYFCYTCDLTVSKGCCSVCARVCHRGHRVVYSRSSRFFCDCGAGGVRGSSCQCLKPRKYTPSNSAPVRATNNFQPFLSFSEDGELPPDSDSDFDEDGLADIESSFKLSIPKEEQEGLARLLMNVDVESLLIQLCSRLLPAVTGRRECNLSKDQKVVLGDDRILSYNTDLLQLKKAYKSGSLDMKIKAEYSNARELKTHLVNGSLIKSLLSVSRRGRLAAGEGDKVAIFDVGQLIGQPSVAPITADKTNVKPLSKNIVRFEIVHILFNPLVENYLAVAGYEECQVLTVNHRGEVTDRLAVELASQGAYIRRIDWVPGSQVQLMGITNTFVKIYDLSQDNISPMHYFTLDDDLIVDATLVTAPQGKIFLLVLSELGRLFRLELSMGGDVGAKQMTDIIELDKAPHSRGLSLYFSSTFRFLFLSYQDGTTLIGRLDANAKTLTEISAIYGDEQDGKLRPAGLHHWKEMLDGSGFFVCFSSLKLNSILAVSIGVHELLAQNLRHTGGSSSLSLVGIAAYRPLSKDRTHCLVLYDDGSLQIYSANSLGSNSGSNLTSDHAKKLGSGILSSRVCSGSNPEFPLDFFEKTVCISPDVKLGGDAIRNGDSESAKQNLVSDDGYLESPSASGFKIIVFNSNPDIAMVGFRIHVGNTSASHIPSEITIFQRVIKLDEGMRSWYDIPFTTAEALLADEEFTISVGPTFNGSTLPRIDSLEVYGRLKDDFGWKEKMDAVLDMEAHVLGATSGVSGHGKKYRPLQAVSLQEQVIADGLKLLSAYYSLFRSQACAEIEDAKIESCKLKCKKLLETIFENDREIMLQCAACHVLQTLFPKKEMYYQVKDAMRLLGVVSASPVLVSRIGIGGATAGWVIQEFTAQMRAVSRIALHRRLNFAAFLETHGSGVIDGLMDVLWGILDLEQPDTQTINNIVIPSVELIYCYAECLALNGSNASAKSVAPAVLLLKKLLFAPYEAVQTSSSLAISSRLLQVPFPKQTMLATDDVVESSASAPVASDPTNANGGNTQIMLEEDSTTSSVQYCCDGCSTVPILRRRWHCNVCPDFDLCEACFEVMDVDRLPPPHSRDHPMSAIPIEIDSLGEDGNEIHFAIDELSDPSLLHGTTNNNVQNSPPSVHQLEHNESGEFPASLIDQRIVTISAAKRAVNSLLLGELIEQLKGWMGTTSGARAIPIMQLFYRLSSAVGGPFMDSSKPENLDLEKFVRWFLDEINLSKPLILKMRSSFGEVVILVFMFFTLMLRNWHQPGSDSSLPKSGATSETQDKSVSQLASCPSTMGSSSANDDQDKSEFASQLVRACSALRQQPFINYLMDILQQLMHIFKSPSSNLDPGHGLSSGSGCGALLTIRKELPAGNFSPFFSDSYAKAHRSDFFADYHRLLLENTFRLVYGLVRPEKVEKSGEKENVYKAPINKDLKLDGYQDVLCSYISNPHTTFVRRYARRLFLHLCGSKTHYYSVRDAWQLSSEIKKLFKLVNKSGGFQNPLLYERIVKLVKCLSVISELAGARPRNWQKYCSRHGDVLPFLLNGVFVFGEESVIQALKLLRLAFHTGKDTGQAQQKGEVGDAATGSNKAGTQSSDSKKKKKSEEGSEASSEKSYIDMEQSVEIFTDKDGKVLQSFIDSFLLEWNSSAVRLEAKCVLYGAWHHGKRSFQETLLKELLQKMHCLPMYGQNITEFTELLTSLLGKGAPDNGLKLQETELANSCLTSDVLKCIFDTLRSQNELLANHPNARIYNTLSGLVEFDGYYLESEPCVACSCPEVPYSRTKLECLKSETKFTDNRIIVKCTGSYTIQSVTMNVHDARKSKSVKVLNLYYNNRPVADLSELKNNWSLWKRAKSCHLAFNQTELKVEFPIPITACNFMIELDSFYENLQASSLESLQCPRCSRYVTDKHGICGNCHENAYQCRQCRNINYENLDSFLCNECGYSKYGRFEFNFMAKPSFTFDSMENDEDMKKGLIAIESESENAHRRYQQLLGFKKPLLKLVSSIGESEMDSQQKDTVQQMMVSLPSPSCKINRKIALLGVLYGEKCKAAFDSVSKSVQTLQGLRRVLMNYLHQKHSDDMMASSRFAVLRSPNHCYGCATTFVTQCLELLHVLSKYPHVKKELVGTGILSELFENNIHQGPKTARIQARAVLCAFSEGDASAVTELNNLIRKKVTYCLEHHRSMDIALATREELLLLSETCAVADEFWEARLRVAFQLLFSSIKLGARHPSISENIILPCLKMVSQACTPPKSESVDKEQMSGKTTSVPPTKDDSSGDSHSSISGLANGNKSQSVSSEKHLDSYRKGQNIQLVSYSEWEKGASYLDFVRRQYKVSPAVKPIQKSRKDSQRVDYLALKYVLRWKRRACKGTLKSAFSTFELGSWVSEIVLSACSQSIRAEMCTLIGLLCAQNSSRRYRFLNLLMALLPATLSAGESSAEYFELFFKMIESEDARLFLAVKGCLSTICRLITVEVGNVESQERSLHIDISQGFILHKLIELLSKFLEVANIRARFMRDELLSQVLEALLVIRGLVVQKTKLISDCNRLLKDLLDSLLLESSENKRHFIRACISGLQIHGEERKGRTSLFILEQLCNMICPSKPEPVYLLILNKAHTQEEFIRGSMTKNPYSSSEIGPLMRDVKNKICHQLDLLGLLEDDYGMELLVGGNIISLDLSISQVYEQVWKKSHSQSPTLSTGLLSGGGFNSNRDCPPMTVTYRLQGLDGEATEPMIKELDEDREESQDPEVEFAIAGAVRECGGLEIILSMIQRLRDDELKSNQEELGSVLNLLMYCCKIRENRRALLKLGALGLLLETARRAFFVDAVEPAEGILLIVESLTMEANESDIGISESVLAASNEGTSSGAGEQARRIVLMFLERLSHPSGLKKSAKQQRNNEMVARILPCLTYGEQAAMEVLIQHFEPHLQNWGEFDRLQKEHQDNPKDESLAEKAAAQRFAVENFVRVSESLKTSSSGERLMDMILERGITELAVDHLRERFSIVGQDDFKSSLEWASGLKLPSVPIILSMFKGLAVGHLRTQRCIEKGGILPLFHALEGVSAENEIGARAENLLDTLADKEGKGDGYLGEAVHKLRHATRDEMRRRALKKREELLQGLGMRQELASDGGERIVVTQPAIEGLDEVEEEEGGLACMVCREGYTLRPNDMLGAYSYCKRVNLGGGEYVYTTVSHFNVIHFQCHQEAKRADAALKNPKKEWEGAALRNNKTLCNCIFPLRGPAVPILQYSRCVDQYWDNLGSLGRADGSRLRLLTYDVVLMLARFATGASFSADSKGGGRDSNSRLLPFMLQMSCHLLDQPGSTQRCSLSKSISSYLSQNPSQSQLDPPKTPPTPKTPSPQSDETVQFMMVNSLLAEPYDVWAHHRLAFLQRGLHHAYAQYKQGRSTHFRLSPESSHRKDDPAMPGSSSGEDLFAIVQPMLVYTGLVEQLQRFFKPTEVSGKQESGAGKPEAGKEVEELEGWEMAMREKLLNVREMVGFSKEVLGWLEEMQGAEDLQKAFDVAGILVDALSGGFSSVEEFVRASIAT
ncbi:auxin transport protein BIG [Amborella trichopoda]|uniref:auxin transport protein BIG n=1 Tax=Amborella trichopoda TaxID=13333 RepID=UPI0005D35BA9|nr:auxin transport protein BIG [Amborella trichopoda]|eukprot:XP_020522820.1 auxin transport protein BIG [Amborella trichopoda]